MTGKLIPRPHDPPRGGVPTAGKPGAGTNLLVQERMLASDSRRSKEKSPGGGRRS